jgi:hypothetical protein
VANVSSISLLSLSVSALCHKKIFRWACRIWSVIDRKIRTRTAFGLSLFTFSAFHIFQSADKICFFDGAIILLYAA